MKNVYLVQANAVYGDEVKNAYIPYAIGCLAAYAFSDERIKQNYALGKFIYTRENIDTAVNSIENPYIVGFSSNVWNNEYNKAFAAQIKKRWHDCIIVFGGHHVSPVSERAFSEYKDCDILIHGGGEEAFADCLLALTNTRDMNALSGIKNISYRTPDGKIQDGERKTPCEPDYPSPYLVGIFEPVMYDGIEFSAIIETNRGCPNHCAFCDWGVLKSKVRLFDIKKVKKELEWIAQHKIEYVYCADANFGLFDRDMEIIDYMISLREKYGYPKKFKVNFTKNRCDFVGDISKKLSDNNMGKSQTLSFQSVDKTVLRIIGRKNIDLEHFKALLDFYNEAGIPTYSELILGLPGETYESFTDGICTLIENGQHKSINVYPCELLPNSHMGSDEFVEEYGIHAIRIPFSQFHCEKEKETDEITEFSSLIVSTDSMSRKDWVDSYFFSTVVQSFHNLSLIREAAILMRNAFLMPYKSFYTALIDFAFSERSTYLKSIFGGVKKHLEGLSNAENPVCIYDTRFGAISYEPDESLFLQCVYNKNELFTELESFLCDICPDKFLAKEAVRYQKNLIKIPGVNAETAVFGFDFPSYFAAAPAEGHMPEKKKTTVRFFSDNPVNGWSDYARECVWYGRRSEGMKLNAVTSDGN